MVLKREKQKANQWKISHNAINTSRDGLLTDYGLPFLNIPDTRDRHRKCARY